MLIKSAETRETDKTTAESRDGLLFWSLVLLSWRRAAPPWLTDVDIILFPHLKLGEMSKTVRHSRKVRVQPKTIEEFYKARGKDTKRFTINDQGDLVAGTVKEGESDRIFTLPKYRLPTFKEVQEADLHRRELTAKAEGEVQDAQRLLREKLEAYRVGEAYASDVVLANIDVTRKEKELQSIAYPVRVIKTIDSIDTNKILMAQRYEVRKFPYQVHILAHSAFPLQEMYVREGEVPEEAVAAVAAAAAVAASTNNTDSGTAPRPMTTADRGRLGGILKVRRTRKA